MFSLDLLGNRVVAVCEEQSLYEQLSGGFPTAQESRTTAISVSCAQREGVGKVRVHSGVLKLGFMYKISRGEAKKLLNPRRKARNNLQT